MVRTHGHLDSDETNEAAWVATRGAVTGAARVRHVNLLLLGFWSETVSWMRRLFIILTLKLESEQMLTLYS